jgi:hypothetical protein
VPEYARNARTFCVWAVGQGYAPPTRMVESVLAEVGGVSDDVLPYFVVVDGRRSAMPWGKYPTQGDAVGAVRKLMALGMAARVVRDDEAM